MDGAPLDDQPVSEKDVNTQYDASVQQEDKRSVVIVDRKNDEHSVKNESPDNSGNNTVKQAMWDEERRAKLREIEVRNLKYSFLKQFSL